jgi:hypothetical protein
LVLGVLVELQEVLLVEMVAILSFRPSHQLVVAVVHLSITLVQLLVARVVEAVAVVLGFCQELL